MESNSGEWTAVGQDLQAFQEEEARALAAALRWGRLLKRFFGIRRLQLIYSCAGEFLQRAFVSLRKRGRESRRLIQFKDDDE